MKTKYLLVPFSYVFHPIFISIYGALLYFVFTESFTTDFVEVCLSILQIFILTILLPLSFYMLLRSLKKVKSFTEATLEERKLPIFIQLILMYGLLKFTVFEKHFPELYLFFQAGFFSSFLVFLSVICWFKASLHMIGVSSLLVFTAMFTSYLQLDAISTLAYLIMCVGFVASSRLYMKAHTVQELIVGMLLGVVPQIVVWYYKI